MKKNLIAILAALAALCSCQEKAPVEEATFAVEKTSYPLKAEGGTLTISVKTNQKCLLSLSDGASSWVHLTGAQSDEIIKNQGFGVTVDPNLGSARKATLEIAPVKGSKAVVTIEQEASAMITTSISYTVDFKEETSVLKFVGDIIEFVVMSNLDNAPVQFMSSDEKVVKYLGEGKFEAVGGGVADVIMKIDAKPGEYSGAEARCKVSVFNTVASWMHDETWIEQIGDRYGALDVGIEYVGPGFNNVVFDAEGKGELKYWMADRTKAYAQNVANNNTASYTSAYYVASKGQLGIKANYKDDYALWTLTDGKTYPAGTMLHFFCHQNGSGGAYCYWILEYKDGDKWVMPEEYPVQTINDPASQIDGFTVKFVDTDPLPAGYAFDYNLKNKGDTDIEFTVSLKNATGPIEIRQTCVSTINSNGVYRSDCVKSNCVLVAPLSKGGCHIDVL